MVIMHDEMQLFNANDGEKTRWSINTRFKEKMKCGRIEKSSITQRALEINNSMDVSSICILNIWRIIDILKLMEI